MAGYSKALYSDSCSGSFMTPLNCTPIFFSCSLVMVVPCPQDRKSFSLIPLSPCVPQTCSSHSLSLSLIIGHKKCTSVQRQSRLPQFPKWPRKTKWLRFLQGRYISWLHSPQYSCRGNPQFICEMYLLRLLSNRCLFIRWQLCSFEVKIQSLRRMERCYSIVKIYSGLSGHIADPGGSSMPGIVRQIVRRHFYSPLSESTASTLGHLFHRLYRKAEYFSSLSKESNTKMFGLASTLLSLLSEVDIFLLLISTSQIGYSLSFSLTCQFSSSLHTTIRWFILIRDSIKLIVFSSWPLQLCRGHSRVKTAMFIYGIACWVSLVLLLQLNLLVFIMGVEQKMDGSVDEVYEMDFGVVGSWRYGAAL